MVYILGVISARCSRNATLSGIAKIWLFPLTRIPLSFPRRQRYLAARTIAPRYRNSHLVPDCFCDFSYITVREPRTEQDRVNGLVLDEILAYLYCFCLIPHYNRKELIPTCVDSAPMFVLVRIRSMSEKKSDTYLCR